MMRSLERYLLAWLLGALLLGSMLVVLVTYIVTYDEMNEVFDAELKNVAQALSSYHSGQAVLDQVLSMPARNDTPDDSEIVTLTWSKGGQRLYASDPRVAVPFRPIEGLERVESGAEEWIVYTDVRSDGVSQAAQRVAARRHMAQESAAKLLLPLLLLSALVAALVVFALRRGLQPLAHAARDIAARSAMALHPVADAGVPSEVAPLVASINDLIARLGHAFSAQRRFMADAAHELRSPLTALRLQLQLLKTSGDEASRAAALAALDQGIVRSQRLIEQLLQVARSEPDGEPTCLADVELGELARSVVSAACVKADRLQIDLGANVLDEVSVRGDRDQLAVLLTNLVENALRYTPPGGVVDVAVARRDGAAVASVIDDGPGIPAHERERVFDRFYRGQGAQAIARDGTGSGLGLAIVRAIAQRHAAQVTLHTPASGRGLEVRVAFPSHGAG